MRFELLALGSVASPFSGFALRAFDRLGSICPPARAYRAKSHIRSASTYQTGEEWQYEESLRLQVKIVENSSMLRAPRRAKSSDLLEARLPKLFLAQTQLSR